VLRLKLASGAMDSPEDFMEMAQLALQAGLAAEARQIVERAYASGAFGSGPQAERQQRLRDLAERSDEQSRASIGARAASAATAKDGNALVQAGMVVVAMGQTDPGIALIEQGIAKGGKRPDDATPSWGSPIALGPLPQGPPLRGVRGKRRRADIARLWLLLRAPK
jgi:hypothetical protein